MEQVLFSDLLIQNQTRCQIAFNEITDQNKGYRVNEQAASVGFIYRHVGETMTMFGYFFGVPPAVQNTTMGTMDEGQGENLDECRKLVDAGYALLQRIVDNRPGAAWPDPVETPFWYRIKNQVVCACAVPQFIPCRPDWSDPEERQVVAIYASVTAGSKFRL